MSALAAFGWGVAFTFAIVVWDMRKVRLEQRKVREDCARVIRRAVADNRTDVLLRVALVLADPTARELELLEQGESNPTLIRIVSVAHRRGALWVDVEYDGGLDPALDAKIDALAEEYGAAVAGSGCEFDGLRTRDLDIGPFDDDGAALFCASIHALSHEESLRKDPER